MLSDVSANVEPEGGFSGFCCMHVINTHNRVILVSEKRAQKFQECAAKCKEVEGSSESKVTALAVSDDEEPEGPRRTSRHRQNCS